ncbi:MAG: tryptophan-rich sensory protein [Armatimonadetes bacterium]|nr:tryptophan-rich sensory protein [Armatimonadota bacterium]
MGRSAAVTVAGLAFWLVVPFAAAALGARFMPDAWFQGLRKPPWNPPGWVFAPVWTVLYASMGVAAWLVWREGGFAAHRVALGLFGCQLLLNALWTPLFFGAHRPGLAFADITALWLVLIPTTIAFWSVRPLAGALLVPYVAWVTFAAALNFRIWQMNA